MSLSPFDSFQSRFVTYLLNFPRIFRQPLHVSGASRPIIRRHNRMYTTIGTYYFSLFLNDCLFSWLDWNSNPTKTTNRHLKRIISTNCCVHTVLPSDDGPRYARNMQRLTKDTKNKLRNKLVFLYREKQCTPLLFLTFSSLVQGAQIECTRKPHYYD